MLRRLSWKFDKDRCNWQSIHQISKRLLGKMRCTSCLKECKTGAIAFFLGADIGGMGSEMTVNESKDTILWKIKKYTGEEQTIEINKKDSNKY